MHVLVFGTAQNHTELAAFAMAFNMTLPMVAWMRDRRHTWEHCGEMAAAMFVPAFVLLVLFWLGGIPAGAVLPLQMALMLPSMVVAMLYRVDEYSKSHPATPERAQRLSNARRCAAADLPGTTEGSAFQRPENTWQESSVRARQMHGGWKAVTEASRASARVREP